MALASFWCNREHLATTLCYNNLCTLQLHLQKLSCLSCLQFTYLEKNRPHTCWLSIRIRTFIASATKLFLWGKLLLKSWKNIGKSDKKYDLFNEIPTYKKRIYLPNYSHLVCENKGLLWPTEFEKGRDGLKYFIDNGTLNKKTLL